MPLREDLHAWLAARPLWQQELARRLVVQLHLSDAEVEEILRQVKADVNALAPNELVTQARPIGIEDLPSRGTEGSPRLVTLGPVRGVAAISPDESLTFQEDGLTVVYGANASGKSSYVRALKQVCRTVPHDMVLHGNAFRDEQEPQRAKVQLSINGQRSGRELDLLNPTAIGLEAVSVFDSRCGEMYVDETNRVAFIPEELKVLERLAATQKRMQGNLVAEAKELKRSEPSFNDFARDTPVQALLRGLVAERPPQDVPGLRSALKALAHLTPDEGARLQALREIATANASKTARAAAQGEQVLANQGLALVRQLEDLRARMAPDAQAHLRASALASWNADAAVETAAKQFSTAPLADVGSGPWEILWNAARDFAVGGGNVFPPAPGQPCPLCLQEIGTDAADRLAHFQDHVTSSVKQTAQAARTTYEQAFQVVDVQHVNACRNDFLAGLRETVPAVHQEVEAFLIAIQQRFAGLQASPGTAQVTEVAPQAIENLRAWANARSEHSRQLLAAQDPTTERRQAEELAELDAREHLAMRMPEVATWLLTLEHLDRLRRAHAALKTNSISIKQTQLAERAITKSLTARLRHELEHLRCDHLPVTLKPGTEFGEPRVGMRFDGADKKLKLSSIASEGEHRALALSFFLAEVAANGGDATLVIDDPVSSLDHERKLLVAQRLVEEAKTRQVIVFTHDLPFLLDLQNCSREQEIEPAIQSVWRTSDAVGLVSDRPPFDAMSLKDRMTKLTEDMEGWDKQVRPRDQEEARARVRTFYGNLRDTWERAVEETLFNRVVTRLKRDVNTRSLDEVFINAEFVAAITEGMTRCSLFAHDSPAEAPWPVPTTQDMRSDLERLRKLVKDIVDHRKAEKKARKEAPTATFEIRAPVQPAAR